jgi:hypothetical protein
MTMYVTIIEYKLKSQLETLKPSHFSPSGHTYVNLTVKTLENVLPHKKMC